MTSPEKNVLNNLPVNPGEVDVAVSGALPPVGGAPVPIFTPAQIEEQTYRRYNPFATLTASRLATALEAFDAGDLRPAAILWAAIIRRDPTIATIKAKREEAVALRDWSVQTLDEGPAAADQAAALTMFYRGVVATSALNAHATGGFSLLCTQMMDAVPYGFAVHHLIYQPNAARTFKLPSGAVVPSLSARMEQVPLEFFEARTGRLRFLGLDQAYTGAPLAPGAWLITTGPCVMMATAFKHYAKRLAEQDLINFSEKFGTPGMMVHTTAQQGTPEGAAAEQAAKSLGSNYRGVVFGASENKTEFLWPSGGTGAGNLPMTSIIEEIKRELTSLWLGADLSTMSRGGAQKGVGASLQADEQEKREQADCARISETLNAQVDPTVLRWFFGDAPVLARVVLESPINEDRALLGDLTSMVVALGGQVPMEPIQKRLGVPIAKKGEATFVKPAGPMTATPDSYIAANVDPGIRKHAAGAEGKLRAAAGVRIVKAISGDRKPIRERLDSALAIEDPLLRNTALRKFVADAPALLAGVNEDPDAARATADAMSAAMFNGVIERAAQTHGSADQP